MIKSLQSYDHIHDNHMILWIYDETDEDENEQF